jgi:histidyl-tRNA synthetase
LIAAGILSALSCRCLDQLGELLGESGADALADLQQLWALADGYGFKDWLVFDASVVRGLAYYTGAAVVIVNVVAVSR